MNFPKKLLVLALTVVMIITTLAACVAGPGVTTGTGTAAKGQVYFLNFKPEQADAYKAIATEYTASTGIAVKVETAASGTYEQQLKSEIAKTDAPTIFQINGPVGYASWKDYTADLSKSTIYSHLLDKSIAITEGDGVYGIPFAIEGYGIIYNNAIMTKYFALSGAVVASMDKINNFDTLKKVVEDMSKKKSDLGIEGVFASTSLATGEDWRWQTHLANVPIYYEFQANKVDLKSAAATAEIKFQYGENFQKLFDLYLNNSTVDKKLLGSKSVNDSMAEFALGKAAMVQNGNWAYGQISGVSGNTVKAEDVKFLPLYMGISGEETQGLCIGTENFFCINKKASAEDQQASLDFLNWLYTSDKGKAHVTKDLGFIAPFDTFGDADKPSDPLAQEVLAWSAKSGIKNVPWNFTVFPSQTFKDNFGAALLLYAQGNKTWADVTKTVIDGWKTEKASAAK
ncbi:MAG: ABC transporter substrate-binding protein [Clostridiaceae bacterium]|nr:ABC transporter substrate-binding protein [Clostridiaceae bacterium]